MEIPGYTSKEAHGIILRTYRIREIFSEKLLVEIPGEISCKLSETRVELWKKNPLDPLKTKASKPLQEILLDPREILPRKSFGIQEFGKILNHLYYEYY